MKMKSQTFPSVGILALLLFQTLEITAAEKLTYSDLAGRLTDLEALAMLPPTGEKCQQWSSYWRKSRYEEATGKYVGWAANFDVIGKKGFDGFVGSDGAGIIREEGGFSVLAEMEGPGVIWRIWSALPAKGHLKIFLDGATEPAVDLPFAEYFKQLVIGTDPAGHATPFQGTALCHLLAGGWNSYVPIPYQKSCKIVADQGWGIFYHFTYTTYPQGTKLPTFARHLTATETAALAKANEFLEKKLGADPAGQRAGEQTEEKTVTVGPGSAAVVAELIGPRAITALRAKLALPAAPADMDALRELGLRITWDGDAQPAVWAPLGDFFGAAPGYCKYRSLPLGMTDDGCYALWYMPFGKQARIELVNDGKEKRTVACRITHAPLTKPADVLGRFHAKYHRDAFLPDEPERRAIDWTMLKAQGRGRLVGVMLHVWNPLGGWWGEGDEKFFVDGEKFPSTFGTGSEDYFGYAWCCPALFENAFHNQTRNDGNNKGHVSVSRWHIADSVPFQTSFEAAIEKYQENDRPTRYAATVYWYQAAGQTDGYPELPLAERTGWYRFSGALEGEELKSVEQTGGHTQPQDLRSHGGWWSNEQHLWWTGAKPGDRLTLAVPVQADGKYKLTAQLTKASDYGIVQLWIDSKKLGAPLDLYNPSVVPTGALDLGVHELKQGDHRLTLEITGANAKAVKAYMAGLDYVKLERVSN